MKEYTLDTKDIYNVDKTIYMYNLFITKNNILLLSVLPDLEDQLFLNNETKLNNWERIDVEKIKDQILTDAQIVNIAYEWSLNNTPERKTMDYKLVKKERGVYYVSKYCLTELFNISSIESLDILI